ncbi:MAG TPA: molecular chaperone HtpG [Gemmataceae bacterium]|nr:molecular chaperone HtpG [Gemmataceae bacterium]
MSAQTLQFKTELKQVLDIIIHSLYSHKDVFLRELISNASDAVHTLRFQGLTRPELLEGNEDWKIKLTPDPKNDTLTISDNGVGMTRESVVENLGTIAKSGTKALLEGLRQADVKDRPELIGQFGVGFYSAFMVADRVTVVSRAAGAPKDQGVRWESNGQGEFTVEPVTKETRGTDVILHLKGDAREFLDPWRLRELVKKHSDFVEFPIVMDVEKEEGGKKETAEETLNSQKAIWLRAKSEISKEEHDEFYKHLSHDTESPGQVIHYSGEGAVEFRALLYVPKHRPFDLIFGDQHRGVQLYVRRVFIMDDSEALLPPYLRFVKGVVDSPDLPLNVSREMIQQSAPLAKIKNNLVHTVLRTLATWKAKEPDAYAAFYRELGPYLKEGIVQDHANCEKLADLLLIESTKSEPGKPTTLGEYVERMPVSQPEIYYLVGENRSVLEHSPHLEGFRARDREVLLFTEPIDEFMTGALTEYKGKKLKAIDKGDLPGAAVDEEAKKRYQPLLDLLKGKLGDEVKEVRLSARLKESAAVLVSDEWAMGPQMARLMERMGRGGEVPPSQRVLELNPSHPAVEALQKLHAKDANDARLEKYGRLLYDEALIAEGSRVKDPAALARTVNELLVRDAAG